MQEKGKVLMVQRMRPDKVGRGGEGGRVIIRYKSGPNVIYSRLLVLMVYLGSCY